MFAIQWLAAHDYRIAFSIQGHTLMTLLISYLVVAKINLSYDRYMKARHAAGNAFSRLRELNQLSLSYTFHSLSDKQGSVHQWHAQLTERIIDLMDSTLRVIRNEEQAQHLARNEHEDFIATYDDPMMHIQALRLHLYHGNAVSNLQLLERMKLMDTLNEFVSSYRDLLVFASTPLPFPLLQMARTFLFLWTFSIPFVVRGVMEEAFVTYIFVFFLTYGFVGLELVSVKLVHPFGDGTNDLNVTGMREATIRGMGRDMELFGKKMTLAGDRRMDFRRSKARIPTLSKSMHAGFPQQNSALGNDSVHDEENIYHAMEAAV